MASYCVSGQTQEYLGFAEYLIYQTLFSSIKATTPVQTKTEENSKDYDLIVGNHVASMAADDDLDTTDSGRAWSCTDKFALDGLANAAALKSAVDARITKCNASWSHTVDKLVYRTYRTTNYNTQLYGSAWLKTETDSVVTTSYDKVIGAGDKVIHVTWDDTSDSNTHFLRTMARYEAMDNGAGVDWDERKKAYARNILAINYPSTANDYKLCIDKILNKDDTEYANLCTFLGVSGLSSATWKTYVDSYLTAIV